MTTIIILMMDACTEEWTNDSKQAEIVKWILSKIEMKLELPKRMV